MANTTLDIILILTCQALVDAPDMVRGQMNFKRLSLTDIKIDIPRVPKKKSLVAAMEAAGKSNSSCTNPQVCAKVVVLVTKKLFQFYTLAFPFLCIY